MSFVEDLERPLTPDDLLFICPASGLPPTETKASDVIFHNRWRQVQVYADLFWKRWAEEHLPVMIERQKWRYIKRNISINDIVISINDSTPRSQWPMGRVLKAFSDANGLVRTAGVKTARGEYKRPISKMCVVVPNNYVDSALAWLSNV